MSTGQTPLHVCIICSGNICRSPMAEQVLHAALDDAGLTGAVRVSSAGTGGWNLGEGINPAAARVLRAAGYPVTDHVARQITPELLAGVDLVLVADRGHLATMRAMMGVTDGGKAGEHDDRAGDDPDGGTDGASVRLLRSFDPDADGDDVPDPYRGPDSGYRQVLAMIQAAVPGVLDEIRRRLP